MEDQSYYLVEVYIPASRARSGLLEELKQQWSLTFGGVTVHDAQGTFMGDRPEKVVVMRVYVPARFDRKQTMDYFSGCRRELEERFPEQSSFLITFSEGHRFL